MLSGSIFSCHFKVNPRRYKETKVIWGLKCSSWHGNHFRIETPSPQAFVGNPFSPQVFAIDVNRELLKRVDKAKWGD
jgi:hypothetical protein